MARIVLGGLLGADMGLHGRPEVSQGFLCPRESEKSALHSGGSPLLGSQL